MVKERNTELGGMDQKHLTVRMQRATYTDTKGQVSRGVNWCVFVTNPAILPRMEL